MNRLLAGTVVVALVMAGGYWYRFAESKCHIPVTYDVGTIDERFDITENEVRSALTDAESLWEDATGKNLFSYTPGADFRVDFVFDERQEETNEREVIQTKLDTKEEVSENLRAEYERMVGEYEKLKAAYEERVSSYEKELALHNDEVESWNTKGGAPKEEFERLNERQEKLAEEHRRLNATARELNDVVSAVNRLGDVGNETVQDYNKEVAWYNGIFGGEREFTQGEYRGDNINIYQFDDGEELRRVMAHEFGHALSLSHVEGEQSVMYYLMEGQLSDFVLSGADIAEYERVCGEERLSPFGWVVDWLK